MSYRVNQGFTVKGKRLDMTLASWNKFVNYFNKIREDVKTTVFILPDPNPSWLPKDLRHAYKVWQREGLITVEGNKVNFTDLALSLV